MAISKKLSNAVSVSRSFNGANGGIEGGVMNLDVYCLPSVEEGLYRYGMASGVVFDSVHSDAQTAYDGYLALRQEQQRQASENMAMKGESEMGRMKKVMQACISKCASRLLEEGEGGNIEGADAMASFLRVNVSIELVLEKYFKIGRYLGHVVHSPRKVFDICMRENMDTMVEWVMKGPLKSEDIYYMQAASLGM